MNGALLDTHTLIWLYDPAPMSVQALVTIDLATQAGSLYISPISAWELGAASRKKNPALRPRLRGLAPEDWFIEAIDALGVKTSPISEQIALEACTLPTLYGHADPGDCFLIATAHVLQLTLITRDQRILEFSRRNSSHLITVAC
jgi:PIN domain nuclease of toxin-antitoxin system